MGLVIVVAFVALFILSGKGIQDTKELQKYKRQMSGQLDASERLLQSANASLGLSQSKLVKAEELLDTETAEFDKFRKEHRLIIKSRDRTIASLKQEAEGTATVIEKDGIISYSWKDRHNRFSLTDDNIFVAGDEVFVAKQTFRITGSVWRQKDGFLKTRKLVLEEVYKDSSGAYTALGTANIVESKFNYTEEAPAEPPWIDLKLRARLSLDTGWAVGAGLEVIELFGIGLGVSVRAPVLELNKSSVALDIFKEL